MRTYIAQLRASAKAEQQAQLEEERRRQIEGPPLDRAIKRWFATLSPEQQQERFYMAHLCTLFGVHQAAMGDALRRLGWERKREWTTASNRRYWVSGSIFLQRHK